MKLAIVAGEASGDLHASEVVRELRKVDPALEMFGIGGDRLAGQGMTLLHHAREMGIVGLVNVLRHLPMFRRIFADLMKRIEAERPDAVLLVDYPDFNLRVAKKCRKLGLRVIYYISPQIWAWRRGRVRQIARTVDRMIVIFPFEETFYIEHGVNVTYVGHPLVEELHGIRGRNKNSGRLRIALMPGSRRMEVRSLLPPMLDAIEILGKEREIEAYVIQAPTISVRELRAAMGDREMAIVPHDGGQALADADLALSSSGTATLESAILDTPVVVMYRLSPATYFLAKRLVKLPHFSLVNIVAGKRVVPELLQSEVNGPRIAAEVRALLEPSHYAAVRGELATVRGRLGDPGASQRVANEILRMAEAGEA
ncbi:MAG: lipid-A-disaccharide synthase [Acidobacteriota bacterium]